MMINSTYAILARLFCLGLAANFSMTNALAGVTKLAAEPLASSITTDNRPNVMFVLDDSGSMYQDFLPDWAGPISSVSAERFFNAAFNGLAYNPGSQYKPPATFTAAGALDTTRYPSQTGMDSDGGADSSTKPNWKAVKEDGYGVQSAATGDLTTGAFYYTTVSGEYCDSVQLRNCVAATAPTGSYTFPAKLRWCTTSAKATGTTSDSNGYCQAANINTTAVGVTNYTYARMPSQRKATLNFSGAGTVSSITVGGVEILSASASGGSSTDLATAITNNIKACTYARVGNCLTATGYRATSAANVVTIYAPVVTSVTPVVTGASPTITAFAVGGTPGDVLLTVISPDVTSYAYPGSAAKHIKRTDCAGTTCTYAEEMTNFANWYAYYHTRMQAMKTASSLAFSTVSDRYRVGFYSINPTGSFLNLGIFSGSQKYNWYQKLLSADVDPTAAGTPLRIGLANVGRMYAGKLTALNGETVNDPVQYSCQRNYTILSTDGYWNDTSLPVKVDGSTQIGQQDGNELRPYYDGASQTKTVSQTEEIQQQILKHSFLVESQTQQQQTTSRRLDQSVVTTMTYPWTEENSYLQTRSTPLVKSSYNLISTTYPLTSSTKYLRESIYKITATPRILQSYTLDYLKTTIPLQQDEYKIKKTSTVLQQKEYKIKQTSTVLQQKEYKIKQTSTVLQQKEYKIKQTSTVLQQKEYKITVGTSPLNTSTYKIKSTISKQLQMYKETNSTYGDGAWTNTGWVDVSSCTVRASGPNVGANYVRNTQCRYRTLTTPVVTGSLSSCTVVPESSGTAEGTVWSVEKPVACAYETAPTVTSGGTCTAVPESATFAAPKVTCTYGAAVNTTGQSSCTVQNQSSGPTNYVGPAVTCTEEAATTTNVTSCTTRPAPGDFSVTRIECGYTGTATDTPNLTSCTPSTGAAYTSSPYSGPKITCTKNTTPTTTDVTSCTTRPDPGATNFSVTKIDCGYTGTATDTPNLTSCTPSTGAAYTSSPYSGPKITCTKNTTPATTDVTSCTTRPDPGATDFSVTKIDCGYTGTATDTLNQTSCSPSTGAAYTSSPYSGPKITCTKNTTPATTNVTSCTTRPDPGATDFSVTRIDCGYTGAATDTLNQTSCTPSTGAAYTSSPYSGPKITCTENTAPTTTTVTTCNSRPAPGDYSVTRIACRYDAALATSVVSTPATCTPVPQSTGNPYSGPAVTCAYGTTYTTATNLTTCTPQPAPGIVNCGYIDGTPQTNQDSCSVISEAPVLGTYSGPARRCDYQTGAFSVTPVTSCTTVPQSPTFASVQKSCAYDTVGTPATDLSSCTDKAQSTSSPYEGPNVVCGYSGTPSATNNNATTCTANRQTASPYTGPAVDCSYNTTPSTTTVATCSNKAQQTGPNYTGGAAVSCAYGTTSAWVTATAACNEVPQSVGPNYVTEVQCGYSAPTAPAPVATCTEVPQSTSPNYTQLAAKKCVPGAFPVTGAPVVTVVDSCSTDPTSSGSPVVVSTATTCTYRAPVTVNSATCSPVPVSTSSPYVTAVTCPITNTGWVPVAPTCTPAGSALPAVFDATGKIVECRTTDQIGTTSSPVPVATCTAGTAGGTLVQTTCVTNEVSRRFWDPALCAPTVGLPSGPNFITTLCPTTVTTTATASCTEQSPTNPLYQTVTCNSTGGTSNTLADVAAYYYKTDLRTFALGNCTGGLTDTVPAVNGVLCSVTEPMNNVPILPGAVDANTAQHMTTFTLGLGASGLMQYSPTYASDSSGDYQNVLGVAPYTAANSISADPGNGVCSWEASGNACNWPFPSSDQQSTIDDLWHAGVNGRGAYFNATDPDSLSASITQALGSLALAGGFTSSAGLGNSTFSLKSGDYYAFIPSYTSSVWTGELVRRTVYPNPIELSATVDWSAQGKLDAKSHASRTIYANVSGSLGAFNSANFATNANFLQPHLIDATKGLTQYLCSSPDICLSATDQDASHASGAKLVDYLRGDRSNEGVVDDNTKYYRQRAHILGDIVNSSAVYVRKPRFDYVDPGYARYVAANDKDAYGNDKRQAVVYVGANDGMLHAFAAKGSKATEDLVDAAVKAKSDWYQDQTNAAKFTAIATTAAAASAAMAADTVIGQELWAYVPSMAIPNLYQLADKLYKDKHRYFVDATPNVGDVCASNCTSEASAVWKTVLVSGLGRGGRGYFALDVTNPASPVLLWEFTDDNLGYSYGNPEFGKLKDGTWVVMFTSGYNNIPNDDGAGGDGIGRLYVLNAITGAQVSGSPISTGYGSDTSPSGLAKIVAQTISPKFDNTIEAVYGGDLDGNVWRFDVNNDIGASGYDAQLLAILKDGAGNRQSITIRPEVSEIPSTLEKIVYVGTGRFLHRDDTLIASDASGQQSLYAIKDPRASATTSSAAIFDNPGGTPRPAATSETSSRSSLGFIRQRHTQISCPAGAPSTICSSGEQVLSSTTWPVNYLTDNGWFIDLRQTVERANTDPVLALGTLVYNTNMPSDSPCSNGSSYQYWLNYLTGGAVINALNTTSLNLVGKTFGDFLVSGASLVQDAKGRMHAITIGQDGRVYDRDVVIGADPSLVRRTSWRELIRE